MNEIALGYWGWSGDTGLTKGGTASYRVRVHNDAGESTYSNMVYVTMRDK
jgi:hypothetical protein